MSLHLKDNVYQMSPLLNEIAKFSSLVQVRMSISIDWRTTVITAALNFTEFLSDIQDILLILDKSCVCCQP